MSLGVKVLTQMTEGALGHGWPELELWQVVQLNDTEGPCVVSIWGKHVVDSFVMHHGKLSNCITQEILSLWWVNEASK